MSKNSFQKKDLKKHIRNKTIRWSTPIIIFASIISVYLWYENSKEINDLSLIGKGENVVVQVHDPG